MDKKRMMAAVNAVSGMTYQEWRLMADQIERAFQRRLNQATILQEDTEAISAWVDITLDNYCRMKGEAPRMGERGD